MRQKASTPSIVILRCSEYGRFKAVLNAARHPAFIGRRMFENSARQGGAIIYCVEGTDVAASLSNVRTGVLNVLSVSRAMQGRGIGQWIVSFLMPPAVRAIESAEPFFARMGFSPVFRSKAHKHVVVVMVSKRLRTFARSWKDIQASGQFSEKSATRKP